MDDHLLDSAWIVRLQQGDPSAAEEIWKQYHARLVRIARRKLRSRARLVADEEDVVLNAFDSFFRGVSQQRFPRLEDRHDLWQLLLMLTVRKVADHLRAERAGKRGGGTVRGESAFGAGRAGDPAGGLQHVLGEEPSPELAVELADQLRSLLQQLPDEATREIALRKLDGQTNSEIAAGMACAVRTVERKLGLIRSMWKALLEP